MMVVVVVVVVMVVINWFLTNFTMTSIAPNNCLKVDTLFSVVWYCSYCSNILTSSKPRGHENLKLRTDLIYILSKWKLEKLNQHSFLLRPERYWEERTSIKTSTLREPDVNYNYYNINRIISFWIPLFVKLCFLLWEDNEAELSVHNKKHNLTSRGTQNEIIVLLVVER
jgi:hypothetical protein